MHCSTSYPVVDRRDASLSLLSRRDRHQPVVKPMTSFLGAYQAPQCWALWDGMRTPGAGCVQPRWLACSCGLLKPMSTSFTLRARYSQLYLHKDCQRAVCSILGVGFV
ncbi:hypothetical protein IG631_19246 [Alternaria alternata]|nr:hypothetical protein IG631_19246 [Alternaria alternata]